MGHRLHSQYLRWPRWGEQCQSGHQAFAKVFAFRNGHWEDLWHGQLCDVAPYGQRDTASLETTQSTGEEITLALDFRMDPSVFDCPLTLKVRLPETWKTVQAERGGKTLTARTLEHEGALYALVKAVPGWGGERIAPKP
jgi:hypothetical protein